MSHVLQPAWDAYLARLRVRLQECYGEDPRDTLGPPPWGGVSCAAWEKRHGHDVRLGCLDTRCEVVDEALWNIAEEYVPRLLGAEALGREKLGRLLAAAEAVLNESATEAKAHPEEEWREAYVALAGLSEALQGQGG